MRLTAKLVSILVFVFLVLLLGNAYVAQRQECVLLGNDMDQDTQELGKNMQQMIMRVWKLVGEEKALELLELAADTHGRVQKRWVWVDPSAPRKYQPRVGHGKLLPRVSMPGEQTVWFTDRDDQGKPVRLTYVEVSVAPHRIGAVEVAERPTYTQDVAQIVRRRTMAMTGLSLLMGGLVVAGLGHQMVRKPLRQLIAKTRRIGRGDLSEPLAFRRWDEFGELAASINSMCQELAEAQEKIGREAAARAAATEQLRHAERLHTVGRLASGVAHELGTPLNVIGGRAGLIASGKLPPEEVAESARVIKCEAERMTKIIRQLLDFARRNQPQKSGVDMRDVVRELLDLLDPLAEQVNLTISVASQDRAVPVRVDVGQIQQVLTNLLINAAQSMPDGGEIRVSFRRQSDRPPGQNQAEPRPYVCVDVRDQGQGIPEENLPHIFEPFFTTKEVGRGTGLGLSISHGIVEEHGGWIQVQSQVGKGSCFSVYLPEEGDPCEDES